MKHLRDIIKIIVADSSLILRQGVMATIKRASDTDVQFVETDNILELTTKIESFKPHLLIVSSALALQFSNIDIRNRPNLKRILLISSLLDQKIIENFDGVISIYDSAERIHNIIDDLMNYDEAEGDSEEQLSQREKEIICEVVKGKTNKEIAEHLNISVFTILTHRRNIAKKLQIHSATALAIYAIANKLVSISEVK